MLTAVLLLVGLFVLYFGAEWLVIGASDVAAHLKLSKAFIGLTLVAFGTSAPELFVNIIAASREYSGLALANIAGSNLSNLCLGFGLSALLLTFPIRSKQFLTDLVFVALGPCLVLASFLLTARTVLSLWILVPFAVLILPYLASLGKRRESSVIAECRYSTLYQPICIFLLGAVALYAGGELVVRTAEDLSHLLGISDTVIGLTVVAAGTSIPDVAATFAAMRRGELDIGIGNILGSNISNVFIVLGSTLLVAGHSLQADNWLLFDYCAVCLLSLVSVAAILIFQRVTRFGGILLLLFFCTYFSLRVTLAALN